MQLEEYEQNVPFLKTAIECMSLSSMSICKEVGNVVEVFKNLFSNNKERKYLNIALAFIQAYIELGFCYEDHEELFNMVLEEYGTTKNNLFQRKIYNTCKIKVNKSQIRTMIGRWPASNNKAMKISEVVNDIIEKISTHQVGRYKYINPIMPNNIYELIISKNESYFHDIRRKKYYVFDINMPNIPEL